MLRFFYVEDRTLKRQKSIGVFVVYIDTGSSMPISPSKSRDLADENNKFWPNGNDSKQPYCHTLILVIILYANFLNYPFTSLDKRHLLVFHNIS